MKKIVILAVVALLSFALGTAGIYLAMPRLSPDTHDSTRIRLDSLGLLAKTVDTAVHLALLTDSLQADSTDSTVTVQVPEQPTRQDLIQSLRDSLHILNNLVRNLRTDTTRYIADISALSEQVDDLSAKQVQAAELTKSLSKLEERQLGRILSGLDFTVLEQIYNQSSARERTRLLQAMPAEQAARFVRTLVQGPQPENDIPPGPSGEDKETQDAES